MPILPNVGRKSAKHRLLVSLIYTFLIAGSVTMVYPFMVMLSGSIKGSADIDRMDPIPEVVYSERMRFARFQEDRYCLLPPLSAAYSAEIYRNRDVWIPEVDPSELETFRRFISEKSGEFPDHFYLVADMSVFERLIRRNFRLFRDQFREECGTPDEFNRRYKLSLRSWNDFPGVLDTFWIKEISYEPDPLTDKYLEFKRGRPLTDKVWLNIDGLYYNMQATFPKVLSGELKSSRTLDEVCPEGPERELWAEFVKRRLNSLFVRLDPQGLQQFRLYLQAKYPGGIDEMNKFDDTTYTSFDSINASFEELRNSAFFTVYTDFIAHECPPERLRVDTPSTRYREYAGSDVALAPFVANDYAIFKETKRAYLVEAFTRNYINVFQFITIYGRAIFNTFVYIGLSILAALIVNPLAAYALSRFNLKSTYMILMFFMATMAFPGAVTMIPNFLLLKHFGLLNTFWALVLPVAANGFSIFILKGFFDSIPKEIYESALIDGAGEWTMFWRFTMALSKPILALITLSAFTASYTAFMFALIICPDEKMWTLMVWLYQLQQGAHQSVVYAALVLAAIPTLLVFILAQNVIMRGIVVPVEK